MAYDYTAELQALYDAELASFQAAHPEPSAYGHDLTTSKPRGMSEIEIARAEYARNSGYPRDTGNIDRSNIDTSNIDRGGR